MKTSLTWLHDFLPGPPLDADAAAEALTHGGLPVESIEQHHGDTVIDVEVTSNRGDCLSHIGIARELSALLNRPFKFTPPTAPESTTPASSATSVQIEAQNLCSLYTARILRNIKIAKSPDWMIKRLESIGLRAINNVVDVTNYVMFELGQPLHAFDFDKLSGHKIIVREARQNEKLTSIDGRERLLRPGMLVIADANRPVALAGVMGGADSEVSNSTTNILLESARFDPLSVRKTARALAMKSDSSYRFERQIDPTLAQRASLRAAQLILQTAGGELLSGLVSAGSSNYHPKKLTLRLPRLRQLLGTDFPTPQILDALTRLNLSPAQKGETIEVQIPSHRLDLNIEVDLIEEVARIIGYDQIPLRDEISIRLAPKPPDEFTINTIRETLVASGYFESLTFSFVTDLLANDFRPPQAASLLRADQNVRAADARLRPSIIPGLLQAIRHNESNGTTGAKLFEIGSTFWLDKNGKVDERRRIALVGGEDYRSARGAVETLLNIINPQRPLSIIPHSHPGLAPSASGSIQWGTETIGHIGRIDPSIADKLSLREQIMAAELELEPLLKFAQHVPQLHPLPRFPSVRRDLSLVVPESTPYEQIERLIRSLDLPDLEDLEFVTTYRGKPLDKGAKSITITLIFRSPTATLTSEHVESAVQKAIAAAQQNLGATLRV
ncbi:MAG TPA: phenylalanine--tRNA ligase subunit beta [Tepidisphaeraceae bacterium]|jgi:phenylalanyl-tRNA synthetase beta chain|nr:phenylalanine--tRNA ligase subunit beta [Tepidisphaeraceae bacterium]